MRTWLPSPSIIIICLELALAEPPQQRSGLQAQDQRPGQWDFSLVEPEKSRQQKEHTDYQTMLSELHFCFFLWWTVAFGSPADGESFGTKTSAVRKSHRPCLPWSVCSPCAIMVVKRSPLPVEKSTHLLALHVAHGLRHARLFIFNLSASCRSTNSLSEIFFSSARQPNARGFCHLKSNLWSGRRRRRTTTKNREKSSSKEKRTWKLGLLLDFL